MAVVEYDDDEIVRPFDADGGKAAKPHQHVAVAGQHRDTAVGRAKARPRPIMAVPPIAPQR